MGNQQGTEIKRTPLETPCQLSWSPKTDLVDVVGREGHCSAVVKDKIYLFGGTGLNKLFGLSVYDPSANTIRDIPATPGPDTVSCASLNSIGEKLYLFGGLNKENGWNSNVWVFDTVSETWSKPAISGIKPSPRDKHTSVTWGTKLVVFGGFGPAGEEDSEEEGGPESVNFSWFKDTFTFDTETNVWEEIVQAQHGPTAVAAHSAGIYNNKMYVFGGKTHAARTQDLVVLDLETKQWSSVDDAGERPSPSSFHQAIQIGQFFVLYGGRYNDNSHSDRLHVLDCESGGWYDGVLDVNKPSARGQATLSLLSDGGTVVMFGGSGKFDPMEQCCQEYDPAFYKIDLSGLKPVTIPPPPPLTEEGLGNGEEEDPTVSGS